MAFPVGRGLVDAALRDAGGEVGTLDFAGGTNEPQNAPDGQQIVTVLWFSDAQSRCISNPPSTPADSLFMTLWAVPSPYRREIAELLVVSLPIICRWAALAPTRGASWTASGHSIAVRYRSHRLDLEED